ncbi:MAG: 50S ribosomal protein L29 [Candidatus Nomurabacteria bacterium]|jgi:ribosomal protein L29|nr:50S ribosomal protein L29 [Candidatus Nomurabacteria bacterium]
MADKKTTKKTVTNSAADLRKLSVEELQKQLQTARADLLEAQKSLKANELANPHAVTKLRKDVARILTIITAKAKQPNKENSENSNNEGKE